MQYDIRLAKQRDTVARKEWAVDRGQAGITARTCGCFALLPRRLVESSGEISLQLREGDGCLTSGGVARGEVFFVDGIPLVYGTIWRSSWLRSWVGRRQCGVR